MTNKPALRAGADPPAYPDQATRKIATACILLARNLAACVEPDADADETRQLLGLRDAAHAAVRLERTLDEGCTLCEHLRAVVGRLILIGADDWPAGKPQRAIAALSEEVASLCPPVGEGRGGTWSDQPWTCLDELFGFALDSTASDYAALPGAGVDVDVEARLVVRGRGHAADAIATTSFPPHDCAARRTAHVLIDLPRETFSGDQYFALLAKIHHEVFVHSVQALDAPGRREAYGPCCALTEGLMDAAASVALRNAIERGGLPDRAARVRHRFLTRGQEEHVARMRAAAPAAPMAERLAAEARIAGRDLFDLLARSRGGPDAVDWAMRLSMRLNLHALDGRQRRAVLSRIHSGLAGSRVDRVATMDVLFDVAEGGDALALLRER